MSPPLVLSYSSGEPASSFFKIPIDSSEVVNYNSIINHRFHLKGEVQMTEMPRKTISLPPELENAVYELRKSEKYCKCSFSEILRVMIRRGLDAEQAEGKG